MFDVCDPQINIRRNFFLEASAGCGKTYAIENLVFRFLVEKPRVPLDRILIVTFTKMATSDLKERIRKKIQSALSAAVDIDTKIALQTALYTFEQAQIYTIHGFCQKVLKEGAQDLFTEVLSEHAQRKWAEEAVGFTLKALMPSDELHLEQYAAFFENKGEEHFKKLIECASTKAPLEIDPQRIETLNIQKLYKKIDAVIDSLRSLKVDHAEQFDALLAQFRKVEDSEKAKHAFLELVDKSQSQDEVLNSLRKLEKVLVKLEKPKVKADFSTLSADWKELVLDELRPLCKQAFDRGAIFAKIALLCREKFCSHLAEYGIKTFDDLIIEVNEKLKDPNFVKRISSLYDVVFIDEFQDTDSLQWEIFKTLFFKTNKHTIVVGDPKQSIYSFRGADIYTFYRAKEEYHPETIHTLSTNYRSSPKLVSALNALFSHEASKAWLMLSKTNQSICYEEVKSKGGDSAFEKPIIFIDNTTDAILKEIHRLASKGVLFDDIAVLVRNHRELDEIGMALRDAKIPTALLGGENEAKELKELLLLLKAVEDPQHKGHLKRFLASSFAGHNFTLVEKMEEPEFLGKAIIWLEGLKEQCATYGFKAFWRQFLTSPFLSFCSFSFLEQAASNDKWEKKILSMEETVEKLALFEETRDPLSESIRIVKKWAESSANAARIKRAGSGVQVMTIHASKGLEFEYVFVPGIATPGKKGRKSLLVRQGGVIKITGVETDVDEWEDENISEEMRLLYVALTRAREALYIPLEACSSKNPAPLSLFLARKFCGKFALSKQEELDKATVQRNLEDCSSLFDFRSEAVCMSPITHPEDQSVLQKPVYLDRRYAGLRALSFSMLAKDKKEHREYLRPTQSLFPKGPEVGVILHSILEEVDFNATFDHLKEFVAKKIFKTALHGYEGVVTSLFWEMFHKKMTPLDFCLKDLDAYRMWKEMEFSFRDSQEYKGVLRGFMDLFFEHQGKYYLLDWKSNELEGYSQTHLKACMEENAYFLQAKIYQEAIKKYLEALRIGPFEEVFGGFIYYFLRGNEIYLVLRQ